MPPTPLLSSQLFRRTSQIYFQFYLFHFKTNINKIKKSPAPDTYLFIKQF